MENDNLSAVNVLNALTAALKRTQSWLAGECWKADIKRHSKISDLHLYSYYHLIFIDVTRLDIYDSVVCSHSRPKSGYWVEEICFMRYGNRSAQPIPTWAMRQRDTSYVHAAHHIGYIGQQVKYVCAVIGNGLWLGHQCVNSQNLSNSLNSRKNAVLWPDRTQCDQTRRSTHLTHGQLCSWFTLSQSRSFCVNCFQSLLPLVTYCISYILSK